MNASFGNVMAGCLALSAFAIAIIVGLTLNLPAQEILERAVISMFMCYPVGAIAGHVCQRVVHMHIESQCRAMEPGKKLHSTEPTPPVNDEEVIVV